MSARGSPQEEERKDFLYDSSSGHCQDGKVAGGVDIKERFDWDLHHLSRFVVAKVHHGIGGNSVVD